ncbi:MAG: efflux RND transporter periplasmic adaptor subunit [Cytophagaceae bacterium]|nr:efflux RND transporter periplasmic adaptor subunit [Cytophagaceae bacterium]MDW8455405.1 efflux RND transporter periplasmic adaptor subunit [Cytophagaceae bacterium]
MKNKAFMWAKAAITVATLSALLISCRMQENNDLENKKKQLAELKKQYAELKSKISALEQEIKKTDKSLAENTKQKLVKVTELKRSPFKHYIEIQGRLESDKNVLISAKSAGIIKKIYVSKGNYVAAGSLIAKIEDDGIRTAMEELQKQLDLANTVYEKQKALWEQKVGTELQYLQAKTTKESLEKRMQQLKQQLDLTLVTATISGTVDEIYPKEGELTAPGAPVCRIINTSRLKVTADVAEAYLNKIKKGNIVSLYFPDINYTTDSYITSVSDVINQISRTFSIEAALPSIPKTVKANMVVYVKILDYQNPSVITVPLNVIQYSDEGAYVYVAENNIAKKVPVTVGSIYKTNAEVISGLKEGDKLITIGYQDMVDNLAIKY